MKNQIRQALRRMNDWTRIAFNDPHAMDHSRTVKAGRPSAEPSQQDPNARSSAPTTGFFRLRAGARVASSPC